LTRFTLLLLLLT